MTTDEKSEILNFEDEVNGDMAQWLIFEIFLKS